MQWTITRNQGNMGMLTQNPILVWGYIHSPLNRNFIPEPMPLKSHVINYEI